MISLRNLKILFVDDIDKNLKYPIYELRKNNNNYYELKSLPYVLKGNLKEYLLVNNSRLCYKITPENKLLEEIYSDKVVYLKYIVENNYEIDNNIKPKIKKKTFEN